MFCLGIAFSLLSVKYLIAFIRRKLRQLGGGVGFGKCELCGEARTDVMIIPCGHFSHCHDCELKRSTQKEAVCSVCNSNYTRSVKIYL